MLEKAMKQAKASVELEGFTVTDEHTALVKAVLTKAITEEEFRKQVNELIYRKNGF